MNRLSSETSPYLLQHADNPVAWWPWCDEALQQAHAQDKPILLSIGYSACHWCHVMAHESFEDAEVAALMNRLFINIKVDREERPDLDHIYQTAHHMLAQRSGGWPLTMFLTPDGTPFFGGTYFPKTPRYGMPGFPDLLERVAGAYRAQRDAIHEQNRSMLGALQHTLPRGGVRADALNIAPAMELRALLLSHFDARHGGFGGAPKFPHPSDLRLLLRHALQHNDAEARHACLHTLRRMAEGGLYDQLGGGFARYSVDERWAIPHFEKMLYDNGLLLGLYADAWALTGEPLFARVVEETAAWTMREMQSPQGGYYASLDADSEHEEGKFYVWSREEVAAELSADEFALLAAHYGLNEAPNFEDHRWHFVVARPLEDVAAELGLDAATARTRLDAARARLLALRETRVRPGRDDKILTSWNALMIAGMARAAAVFGREDWLASAQRACDFLRKTMWQEGRLLATAKDDRAHLNAYLDDHAFLLDALLALMQTSFRDEDLDFATALADALIEHFEDREDGGFHFTRHDHEALILRPKTAHDNAMPSGNGVAAQALQRLGHLLGEPRYLAAAERCLRLFFPSMASQPSGQAALMMALEECLAPPALIVLRGAAQDWLASLNRRCAPDTMVVLLPETARALPPALDKPRAEQPQAWLCVGSRCLPPVADAADLDRQLAEARG